MKRLRIFVFIIFKKRILSVALAVVMAVCLTACGTTYQEAIGQTEKGKEETIGGGYFTVITSWGSNDSYYIVYAKDTKVKYFVKWTGYNFGITPLYNADGTLQIYEESED